jgi:transposase
VSVCEVLPQKRTRPALGQDGHTEGKEGKAMSLEKTSPKRFIGLDVHKRYLVAYGVDAQRNPVLGPARVLLCQLDQWMAKELTKEDAVVLEMTTNSFQLHDDLLPHAHSVTVVHPPHVSLITRAQVMTDKIAARVLANLHAVGLLPAVWVPPQEVRDQRALVAQRSKMMPLASQARNRLHAVLHRHHLAPPKGDPFAQGTEEWWLDLEVSELQRVLIQSDLDTLAYARTQIASLEEAMTAHAAQDERVVLLLQLPGVGLVTAITLLAAIGDINRFASAKQLVSYAGLGSRVHDSGQTVRRGRITKAGRRDIRTVMVEAAHAAARAHQHWRAELARLEPRLGRNKAIVAIARKLLVAVWHVLSKDCADRFADPTQVARMLFNHAYRLGRANRSPGQTTAQYVRQQLDRLNLGAELMEIPWGKKTPIALPPSGLL